MIINRTLFENSEEIDAVLEEFISCKHVSKVFRYLNDNLLDSQKNDLFLVRVVWVELTLEHGFAELARFKTFGRMVEAAL